MKKPVILCLAVALAGCASYSRLNEYRGASTHVHVGRAGYAVTAHPTENSVLVRERLGGAMGGAVVQGLLLGVVDTSPPLPIPRLAGAAYLAQFGCTATGAHTLEGTTTEVTFTCPEGVRPAEIADQICVEREFTANWSNPTAIQTVPCDEG